MGSSVVASVRELLPSLEEQAPRTEAERGPSSELIKDLQAAGVFSMFQPKARGGAEAHPVDFLTVVRLLASACPSTGWLASMLGITTFNLALFEEPAQHDVWAEDANALVSSSYAPTGRLALADDGYRLHGRWKSVPGADQSSWVLLGSLLIGQSGEPVDYMSVLVPKADCALGDHWDVVGLRGTGSRALTVNDAFIPFHRAFGAARRQRTATTRSAPSIAPLYRVPHGSIHSVAMAAPIIGAAEGAYDYHLMRQRKRNKLTMGGRKPAEDAVAHVAIARGTTELDASVLQLERDLREQMDHAERNEPIPIELRLRSRRDQVRSVERAIESIDQLVKIGSGHSVQMAGKIQRAWRDVHTGAAHATNHPEPLLRLYGRWACGLGVDDSMIVV